MMRVIKNNDNNKNDDNDENDDADHAVDNDDVDDGGEGPMVVMVVTLRMVRYCYWYQKKVVVKMNMIMMIATERNHPKWWAWSNEWKKSVWIRYIYSCLYIHNYSIINDDNYDCYRIL